MNKNKTRLWLGFLCSMLACGMLSACGGDVHKHTATKTEAHSHPPSPRRAPHSYSPRFAAELRGHIARSMGHEQQRHVA
jgi:hypothetical protein